MEIANLRVLGTVRDVARVVQMTGAERVILTSSVFGPKTRETLARFFKAAANLDIGVAVLVRESPIQVLQFRNLCRDAKGRADVFDSESDAVRWFAAARTAPR
jgi:hypothetical protein